MTATSWLESTNGGYDSKPRRIIIKLLYSRFNHKHFVDLSEIIWHSVDDAQCMISPTRLQAWKFCVIKGDKYHPADINKENNLF